MLYDASVAGNATGQYFEAAHWRQLQAASAVHAGRGQAVYIESGARQWVLRHYRRGGSVATLLGDRYLWTGEERTRPFREWRLLRELHAEGLPVPVPVAARYQRSGAFYRGDLITERIRDAPPLSALLAIAPLPPSTWQAVGACIRRFHDRGVWHADLNAHNILVDTRGAVFLLDFDRGRRRVRGGWMAHNLVRLRRSLDKINRQLPPGRFDEAHWQLLARAYAAGNAAVDAA